MRDKNPPSLFKALFIRSFMAEAGVLITLMIFALVFMSMLAEESAHSRVYHETVKLEQVVARVEDDVQDVYYAQRSVLLDNVLTRLIYLYDDLDWYTRYDLQNSLQKDMFRIADAYRYTKSAYIYLPSLNKLISNSRVVQNIPAWLERQFETPREGIFYEDGRLFNIQLRMDAEKSDVEAVSVVELDATQLLREIAYITSEASDQIQIRWSYGGPLIGAVNGVGAAISADGAKLPEGDQDIHLDSGTLNCRVDYFISPKSDDTMLGRFRQLLWAFVALLLIYEALWFRTWYRKIYLPLHVLLVEAFGKAEAGDFSSRITVPAQSPFSTVYESYNHMMERMESYVENNLKQQILIGKANLKQLQAQINPHFMYNSYYVLYRLIKKGDMDSAVQLAEHLGQFYQYITRNAEDEKRLEEEVEHAVVYTLIQQFRFRDRLLCQIECPPQEIAKVYVPRLVLQPVLENAFKYAYEMSDSEKPMILRLTYAVADRYHFDILVENSGELSDATLGDLKARLADESDQAEITALINIHRRIRIYFGGESALEAERSELGGLLVRMHIADGREE